MYPRNYSADGADDISRYEVGFVKAFSPELLLLSGCNISVHVLYFVLFHHVFLAYFLSVGCPLYFLILVLVGLNVDTFKRLGLGALPHSTLFT